MTKTTMANRSRDGDSDSTVNLVSHVHGFFPGGRLVEKNTSLESSWSPILIYVGFDLNRGQLDELHQVIVGADIGANRFL